MLLPHIHIPFNKIPEYIDFIIDNKLNLEIYFTSDVLDNISAYDIASLMKRLEYNPYFSIHAPFMDLSPAAIDSRVRQTTIERFSHILVISEILKPVSVVFHSGYEKWRYAMNIDVWLEKSLLTWQLINKRALDIGVKIALENIFEDEPTSLKLLMEKMNSDNFGICFDTGHFNIFSIVPIENWLESLKPYIIELHLHDNNKKSDQHLAIGEGSFDFDNFFNLLGDKNCIHTIEAHTPENVLKSMDYLIKLQRANLISNIEPS